MYLKPTSKSPYLPESGSPSTLQFSDSSIYLDDGLSSDSSRNQSTRKPIQIIRRSPVKINNVVFRRENTAQNTDIAMLFYDRKPVSRTNQPMLSNRGNTQLRQSKKQALTNLNEIGGITFFPQHAVAEEQPQKCQILKRYLELSIDHGDQKGFQAYENQINAPMSKLMAKKSTKNLRILSNHCGVMQRLSSLKKNNSTSKDVYNPYTQENSQCKQLLPSLQINALTAVKIPREIALSRVPFRSQSDSLKRKDVYTSYASDVFTRSGEFNSSDNNYKVYDHVNSSLLFQNQKCRLPLQMHFQKAVSYKSMRHSPTHAPQDNCFQMPYQRKIKLLNQQVIDVKVKIKKAQVSRNNKILSLQQSISKNSFIFGGEAININSQEEKEKIERRKGIQEGIANYIKRVKQLRAHSNARY
ncbi:hypothetical protein FGO68_gene13741 [Halteria grandinella]|uniref:Uncharacterized protein n=1 Tax=Halteria grandinella TaxID=5974 RepID=A0A8J8T197_HALGN|nr:hypothetical protein FGO68_gene13741 [Halteria grandinella]